MDFNRQMWLPAPAIQGVKCIDAFDAHRSRLVVEVSPSIYQQSTLQNRGCEPEGDVGVSALDDQIRTNLLEQGYGLPRADAPLIGVLSVRRVFGDMRKTTDTGCFSEPFNDAPVGHLHDDAQGVGGDAALVPVVAPAIEADVSFAVNDAGDVSKLGFVHNSMIPQSVATLNL